MKVAVSGKGGVGKTTIAGTLARIVARRGYNVIAVDADPNLNLAITLGVSPEETSNIVPISERIDLIRSRVGTSFGPIISFTPEVEDIVEKYGLRTRDDVVLLVVGTVRSGGEGCQCPENAFLRALLSHLVVGRKDFVILDMEAGLEHLGRGTARGVDMMLCVVEPTYKSVETAKRIVKLARDLGIQKIAGIGNKVHDEEDRRLITESLPQIGIPVMGIVPFDPGVQEAERRGLGLLDAFPSCKAVEAIERIADSLLPDPSQGWSKAGI